MENIYYTYEWIRLDNNEPFYVGKGKGNRWNDLNRGNNKHFYNIVKSIPVAVNILQNDLSEEEALEYECWYINYYKYEIGYNLVNMTDGGDKPPTGSGEKNNNYGIKWTDIQKEKARQRMEKNIDKYIGSNNPNSKVIMCVETGEKYSCIKDARNKLNIKNPTSISFCLKDKSRMAYGFHWIEITQENKDYMDIYESRFLYLISCYADYEGSFAIVCIDDKFIIKDKTTFRKLFNISSRKIDKLFNNREIFYIKNKRYVFARDYSRLIQ